MVKSSCFRHILITRWLYNWRVYRYLYIKPVYGVPKFQKVDFQKMLKIIILAITTLVEWVKCKIIVRTLLFQNIYYICLIKMSSAEVLSDLVFYTGCCKKVTTLKMMAKSCEYWYSNTHNICVIHLYGENFIVRKSWHFVVINEMH